MNPIEALQRKVTAMSASVGDDPTLAVYTTFELSELQDILTAYAEAARYAGSVWIEKYLETKPVGYVLGTNSWQAWYQCKVQYSDGVIVELYECRPYLLPGCTGEVAPVWRSQKLPSGLTPFPDEVSLLPDGARMVEFLEKAAALRAAVAAHAQDQGIVVVTKDYVELMVVLVAGDLKFRSPRGLAERVFTQTGRSIYAREYVVGDRVFVRRDVLVMGRGE